MKTHLAYCAASKHVRWLRRIRGNILLVLIAVSSGKSSMATCSMRYGVMIGIQGRQERHGVRKSLKDVLQCFNGMKYERAEELGDRLGEL